MESKASNQLGRRDVLSCRGASGRREAPEESRRCCNVSSPRGRGGCPAAEEGRYRYRYCLRRNSPYRNVEPVWSICYENSAGRDEAGRPRDEEECHGRADSFPSNASCRVEGQDRAPPQPGGLSCGPGGLPPDGVEGPGGEGLWRGKAPTPTTLTGTGPPAAPLFAAVAACGR